jgi:glutaminyl-tRNA synthetase
MSKRKLLQLVNEGRVSGWDDPRMPTISGLRRRGFTASAIRNFVIQLGVTKYPSLSEFTLLEHAVRDEFNRHAQRRFAVLRPIKVVITNYPEGQVEELSAINNLRIPKAVRASCRSAASFIHPRAPIPGSAAAEIFRLRARWRSALKYAYIIKCDEVVTDDAGKATWWSCAATADLSKVNQARDFESKGEGDDSPG